jgi:hypothetical protein
MIIRRNLFSLNIRFSVEGNHSLKRGIHLFVFVALAVFGCELSLGIPELP